MEYSENELRYGYWGSRIRAGLFSNPITRVDEYAGQEILAIAYAREDQSAYERRKIMQQWCKALPALEVDTLYFYAINQEIFDAASQVKGLRALSTGFGRLKSIASITACQTLTSLRIDSAPSLTELDCLQRFPKLISLNITNVRKARDLSFVQSMRGLVELGVCGSLWTVQQIDTLLPLKSLQNLRVLWLYSTRILKDGLRPLRYLEELVTLSVEYHFPAAELQALCNALPRLKYGTLVE